MVDGISFKGSYNASAYSRDLENLAKFTAGTVIVPAAGGPFEGGSLMLAMVLIPEAVKTGNWFLKYNKPATAWTNEMKALGENFKASKGLMSNGGWQNFETYKALYHTGNSSIVGHTADVAECKALFASEKLKQGKISTFTRIKAFLTHQDATELAESKVEGLFKSADEARGAVSTAENVAKEATEAASKAAATGIGLAEGAANAVKEGAKAVEGVAKAASVGSKVTKFVKGNALFLAISGVAELFSNVIPAFQLGTDKGVKQVGKSAVKVAASVGGWAAGDAVGKVVGTTVGAFLGPAGAVVGCAIGSFVGGSIGAWLADKGAEAIVGKSEVEIAKEAQAKELAKKASEDAALQSRLLAQAEAKMKQEGTESEDAKVAFKSLKRISDNTTVNASAVNPYITAASGQGVPSSSTAPNIPSFQGDFSSSNQDFINKYMLSLTTAGIRP